MKKKSRKISREMYNCSSHFALSEQAMKKLKKKKSEEIYNEPGSVKELSNARSTWGTGKIQFCAE